MKSIEELLESMDIVMDKATNVPFKPGKCMVDADELNRIIDDIRINLPQEIRQAKAIVAERSTIIDDAKKEADEIIHKAEDRARALVNQEEIYRQAQAKAVEMITTAQEKSKEVKKAAIEFSDNVLLNTENAVTQSLEVIRQSRKGLRSAAQAEAAKKSRRASAPVDDSDVGNSDEE